MVDCLVQSHSVLNPEIQEESMHRESFILLQSWLRQSETTFSFIK